MRVAEEKGVLFREAELPETNYGVEVIGDKVSSKLEKKINEWLNRKPLIWILDIVVLSKSDKYDKLFEILFIYKKISSRDLLDTPAQTKWFFSETGNGLRLEIGNWLIDNSQIELIKTVDLLDCTKNDKRVNSVLLFYRTKK